MLFTITMFLHICHHSMFVLRTKHILLLKFATCFWDNLFCMYCILLDSTWFSLAFLIITFVRTDMNGLSVSMVSICCWMFSSNMRISFHIYIYIYRIWRRIYYNRRSSGQLRYKVRANAWMGWRNGVSSSQIEPPQVMPMRHEHARVWKSVANVL